MDNTLFDLVGAQIASCHDVARYLGRDDGLDLFDYFLRPDHGFEAHENILDYLNDRNISPDGKFRQVCHIYETSKLGNIYPYFGVDKTLKHLVAAGYRLGVVTDAHSRDAVRRLEKAKLLHYFVGIVSYDMTGKKKPAHDPFLFALDMLKTEPSSTVLVGDSPRRDIEPCHELGIRSVYARYGDRFADDRSEVPADFIIDNMDELLTILDNL